MREKREKERGRKKGKDGEIRGKKEEGGRRVSPQRFQGRTLREALGSVLRDSRDEP